MSCSGHVDRGETYDIAALREFKEELGVMIDRSVLVDLLHSGPSRENGYEFIRSYEVISKIQPVHDPKEISEIREVKLYELDNWLVEEPEVFASSFRLLYPLARKRFQRIT